MGTRGSGAVSQIFQHQADATKTDTPPADATPIEVLAATPNVRIYQIIINCDYTVQPTNIQIHITVDGNVYTITNTNPADAQDYILIQNKLTFSMTTTPTAKEGAFLIEGRSVKVEMEVNGGTIDSLTCEVMYAKVP